MNFEMLLLIRLRAGKVGGLGLGFGLREILRSLRGVEFGIVGCRL